MHTLFFGVYDETIEVVVVLRCRGSRLFSTGFTGAAPNFDRCPEWETKPAFGMELLKLSGINDIDEFDDGLLSDVENNAS